MYAAQGEKDVGVAVVTIAFVFAASLANAELVERGTSSSSWLGHRADQVPGQSNAPIPVLVDDRQHLSGERPPALRFILIVINRGGQIETNGLPVCQRSSIERRARRSPAICKDALPGKGRYVAGVAFPEQDAFPLQGRVLAFNAAADGERATLAHVYGAKPFPNWTWFSTSASPGELSGRFSPPPSPKALNRNGYLKRIVLDLRRDYAYRGRKHSYLSASCGAPSGANIGIFPFVRVGMTFADGRRLASTLIRTCTVRKRLP